MNDEKTLVAHRAAACPLVARRIACDECGYPASEALYADVTEWAMAMFGDAPKASATPPGSGA